MHYAADIFVHYFAVIQQTDEVFCHFDSNCNMDGETMTMRECCLKDNMKSYSTPDGCNQCTGKIPHANNSGLFFINSIFLSITCMN